MLKAITSFFEDNVFAVEKTQNAEHGLKLAAASLLIEMMRMDDDLHDDEHAMLIDLLQEKFELSVKETQELVDLANNELADSTDYYQFTALINEHYEYADKVHMIELLWQIAYADKSLDKEEEYLVRKVAELIYVSHSDYIASKLKIRDALT